ncbi:RNA-directed DNA polymerase, eukaryota [Tanacetum coccineum]
MGISGVGNSYVHVVKGKTPSVIMESDSTPALVLDEECLNLSDLSNSLFGRVKEFASLSNLKMKLQKKLFHANVGVGSWFSQLVQASMDFTIEEGDLKVADKGLCGGESDVEEVMETLFGERFQNNNNMEEMSTSQKENHSGDPFNIYTLLNKNKDIAERENNSDQSLKYPPGYTPNDGTETNCKNVEYSKKESGELSQGCDEEKENNVHKENSSNKGSKEDVAKSICSGHFKKSVTPRTGGSILNLMEELVKVGQTMGYNMDGCVNNMTEIIESQGVKEGNSGGDFNEVRYKSERFGSMFNVKGANVFNTFIANAGLEEVPLGGSSFTWCHKSATKMSKLDRFLISEILLITCPNITSISLEWYLSDHQPILLHTWIEAPVDESNEMINMMKKLKYLKQKIREWNKGNMISSKNRKVKLIDDLKALEMTQKAKIKWSIEGDENSSFYHGVLNKKRSQLNIRGIMVEGIWTDSPQMVKKEFFQHFKRRFDKPDVSRATLDMNYSKTLSFDQQVELELEVSKEEIKRAVWDCGIDKSPGPDGFTFGFYRRFWKVIENDVFKAVKHFFTYGDIPKGCNSSFIALIPKIPDANVVKYFRPISLIGSLYKIIAKILANRLVVVLGDIVNEVQSAFIADRQILDGPFILNEVLQWCKSKKKQSLIFKVDFEKAYDSEFQFHKGLKQGDLLSPFLFILIMESLHLSFQRVVDAGMFKGITLSPSLILSHMFYADDAVFVGQWCDGNINSLVHVLECFFRASGLRINMGKSKLMGVLVDDDKLKRAASKLGCLILNSPFSYLGSKVGGSMHRVQAWSEVVDRVHARLSKWKMKTLSIGGSKKMSWVKWKNVLASKEKGGLGVSSLYALNRGLMFKWVWRFLTQSTSLWARVIKAIHGDDGKLEKQLGNGDKTAFWEDVWIVSSALKVLYPRMYALETCKSVKVGTKLAHSSLDFSFCRRPRGGVQQEQYGALSGQVHDVTLVPLSDRCKWSLENSGDFSVASVRKMIDDKMLPDVTTKPRWIKSDPIKVNVHAWKVKIDLLPTRLNISRRGMDIDSITCSICDSGVESSSHVFFTCHMVRDIIRKITRWWEVTHIEVDSYEEWLNWLVNLSLDSKHKQVLEGVFYVMWRHVWSYRNKNIFDAESSPRVTIFEDIVSWSFHWCRNRCKASFSWND